MHNISRSSLMIGGALSLCWVAGMAAADTQLAATDAAGGDLAAMKKLYQRPTEIPFPADNPYTPAKAELGKTLFFDPRLSRSGVQACVSCHNPSFGWEDGHTTAVGENMLVLGRNSPTIINRAWGEIFFWDGRAASLEEQATGPITAPGEMNMPMDVLIEKLKGIAGYQRKFGQVFPGEGITERNIAASIATFERTVVSAEAPFDRWIAGDEKAISEDAKRGFILFNTKANCASCHSGWTFTDDSFHDIGLPATDDIGRAKIVPGVPELEYAFKTPGLRNIDQRAPYMHDGSMTTLEEVVQHYVDGGIQRPSLDPDMRPIALSDQEVKELVAFMHTLTGQDRPMTLPVLP
ncbi:cytochrome-c peroxidase [Dongia deserti]|uniref:cytochrome-c peroxidase n=1 Tax=Dongia deserti TaxID=2268030 RepID=UPI000E64A5D2|nr:cytochrome c peroxidase [Dongia deserti]